MTNLQENSYMQYFVGLHEFHPEPLFDPSMMMHFRKRFPVEEVAKINEYVCTGKWPEEQRNVDRNDNTDDGNKPPVPPGGEGESAFHHRESRKGNANLNTSKKKKHRRKKNRGKLILDAKVVPADIKYPTDIDLLNKSREHLETAVDILWKEVSHTGHKLPYSAKKARRSYLKLARSKKWTRAKCRKAIGEHRAGCPTAKQICGLGPQLRSPFPTVAAGPPCCDPNRVPPAEGDVRQPLPLLPGSDRQSGAVPRPPNSAWKTSLSYRIWAETSPVRSGRLHLSGANLLE